MNSTEKYQPLINAKIPRKLINDSMIGDGVIDKRVSAEHIPNLVQILDRLLDLQDEYYRLHPFRRLLRNLGLLPDPDIKARMWALERISEEEMS